MAPKKAPKSGFFYFMESLRNKKSCYENTKDFVDYVGTEWVKLSPDEKKKYQNIAKFVTKSEQKSAASFVSAICLEKERIREEEHIMLTTIHKMIEELDDEELGNKKFYLCHVNYYFRDGTYYLPSEIALIEFTLNKGITKNLHFIVKGAIIPLGYRFVAEQWAERTHRIPIEWCTGPNNHAAILNQIVEFLDPGKTGCLPPIFSMPDYENLNFSINAVKSVFAEFSKVANAPPDIFRIFSLPRLFHEIISKTAVKMEGVTVPFHFSCEREIYKDRFVTFQNRSCVYHTKTDLVYQCSLSMIARWAYTVISHCSKVAGKQVILGDDDKSKEAWVALSSHPSLLFRETAPVETIKKSDIEPTTNYTTQRMEREAERIKEEELAARNLEVRLPNVHTISALVSYPNEVPDIGGLRISRNETPAPFWPKELFRNKK